ncbi:hypothetical protein L218DRAFT_948781 [Marasmius fiardii PR-910]|nr:hypothetical protein L218DRAFT_948781 [Marasmius fiardii PR-910]
MSPRTIEAFTTVDGEKIGRWTGLNSILVASSLASPAVPRCKRQVGAPPLSVTSHIMKSPNLFMVFRQATTLIAAFAVKKVFAGFVGLYRYIRTFIYPCLTLFELEQAFTILDNVYQTARNALAGAGEADVPEWNVFASGYLKLKIETSQIRQKSLQGSSWKTYFGFHPRLMLEIAECYTRYEALRCRILDACERDLQSHLEAEQCRRQFTIRSSPQVAFTFVNESPFRSQHNEYPPDRRSYSTG